MISPGDVYERAVALLEAAVTPAGFVASPSDRHYARIWGRDALISSLGALRHGAPRLVEAAAATIDTLGSHASALGQVPALVDAPAGTWDFAEGGVVDVSAWFVIVVDAYREATGDLERVRTWWPACRAAFSWLRHQDVTGSGLVSAAPSTDWMDAALTRSGRTLHLNVLYAWAAASLDRLASALDESVDTGAARIADAVDAWFWPRPGVDVGDLFPHGFAHDATRVAYEKAATRERHWYVSHIVHAAFVEHCDVLANLLAIRAGLVPETRAGIVLDALEEAAVPYPSRVFLHPVEPGDPSAMLIPEAEAVIPPRWRNEPGRYQNGAAWPYIGGFHVEALARIRGAEAARAALDRLAAVDTSADRAFPEWVDAAGTAHGAADQTWSAAAYVLAFAAVAAV